MCKDILNADVACQDLTFLGDHVCSEAHHYNGGVQLCMKFALKCSSETIISIISIKLQDIV